MACGAIPIVTDLDGNREWVAEGDGAHLFPAGDERRLADAIEDAAERADWRGQARERNRRVVETRANAALNMPRIEALLSALAERAKSHG
jgi:glycosyltransferase involved in cell wall biosynthesis